MGDIIDYGSTIPPMGWMVCDGSAISRATYPQLFTTIGTIYGVGDGSTTFNLPGPGVTSVSAIRTITAGDGMTGGGDLSANRTLAVDATVGRTGGTSHYYAYDELLGLVTPTFCQIGTTGTTGAAVTPQLTQVIAGSNGIYLLAPGTVASGGAFMDCGPVFLTASPAVTVTWRSRVWIAGNTLSSSTSQFAVGLTDHVAVPFASGQYYVTFYCIPNAGSNHWQVQNRSNTTVTNADTGIVATPGAWFDLKLVATAATVLYYVNGTLTNTVATNIPGTTFPLYPTVWVNNSSNTLNYGFYVDSVELDLDSGIAGKFMKSSI